MEVLQDSLQPALVDATLSWSPPSGYTVMDSTPEHLGTLHSGNSYTAFARLKKIPPQGGKGEGAEAHPKERGCATIAGSTGDEDVRVHVDAVEIPSLTPGQSAELLGVLSQAASWSRLCELEEKVASFSCKARLNGTTVQPSNHDGGGGDDDGHAHRPDEDEASCVEELVRLSLETGIPTALTVLVDRSSGSRVTQIVPTKQHHQLQQAKPVSANGHLSHQLTSHMHMAPSMMYRKRKRDHFAHDAAAPSFSIASLAKNAISAVSSKLKAVVSVSGLVDEDDVSLALENGIRIDDLDYQQNGDLSLRWDSQRKELVYPDAYYAHGLKHSRPASRSSGSAPKRMKAHVAVNGGGALRSCAVVSSGAASAPLLSIVLPTYKYKSVANGVSVSAYGNGTSQSALVASPDAGVPTKRSATGGGGPAMADDDDVMDGDESSDSSVDPDWNELRPPSELLPLIHMQLFSGAWPMVRAFSYAVGVPLDEMRKLPLKAGQQNAASTAGDTEEAALNLWATAVAVECFKEYFAPLRSEWALVAHKGQCWLEQNLHKTDFSIDRIQSISRSLVSRHA